jgi:hypothetical protein
MTKHLLLFTLFLLCSPLFAQTDSLLAEEDTCGVRGAVVLFKKGGYEIVETTCDSVSYIERAIKAEGKKWAIIGINYEHGNPDANALAHSRAQIVKDELMMRGIPEKQLFTYTQYYPPPKEGESRDWPFLPLDRDYEIGVYFQIDE